jgi:hypothetical protein
LASWLGVASEYVGDAPAAAEAAESAAAIAERQKFSALLKMLRAGLT